MSDIAGDESVSDIAGDEFEEQRAPRPRPVLAAPRSVLFTALVVAGASLLCGEVDICGAAGFEEIPAAIQDGPDGELLGLAQFSWHFARGDVTPGSAIFHRHVLARLCRRAIFGFVDYFVEGVWRCCGDGGPALCASHDAGDIVAEHSGMNMRWPDVDGAMTMTLGALAGAIGRERFPTRVLHVLPMSRAHWAAIVHGATKLFHTVAVTGRYPRQELLCAVPSRKQVRGFKRGFGLLWRSGAPERAAKRRRAHPSRHNVQCVLDWLVATRDISDLKHSLRAAHRFARLFAGGDIEFHQQMMARLQIVPREVIRAARVRLDITCMNLFRRLWSCAAVHHWNIHVYLDGSPQWRELELFAATIEVHGPGFLERISMPFVAMEATQLNATGKCFVFLWMVWLMVGPRASSVRSFCSRIRCIICDQGVERQLAHIGDVLPAFCTRVGLECDPQEGRTQTYFQGVCLFQDGATSSTQ